MNLVILGLSITSSWGNGHATTYRALVREFARRGHRVTFLERDVPWYASNRDFTQDPSCIIHLYSSIPQLQTEHLALVRNADAVIVGSYVPDGIGVGEWVVEQAEGVTAFYDIDTPVTLAGIRNGECGYLSKELIGRYDLYLSFTGGKTLLELEKSYGSPCARPLYCSVDPLLYHPESIGKRWLMGYLGTYSDDRQPGLEKLLMEPARSMENERFTVAGPQYPATICWPGNVERIEHLPPDRHRNFYNSQRFTLNLTRRDMIEAGHSPSVRLFEAAACGTPVISDYWAGIEDFFEPGKEILIAGSSEEVISFLENTSPERALEVGAAARRRVLAGYTAAHRAADLERYLLELMTSLHPASI